VRFVPAYRSRPSPLHAARAGAAASFCVAFAIVAAMHEHPLVVVAALVGALGAGVAAGVGRETAAALKLGLPLALLVTLVNPLVYQGGETVLVRGGELLGRRLDVTLEALAAGGLAGLRVATMVVALGLLSAAVDPDDLLRLFRRVSYRSALTASLATRLVPVLARDATRMADASRCRPAPPGRLAVARAALSGALDRAVDVAASLEVRGYAKAGRPAARPRPWSRHDLRAAASAALVMGAALAARVAGAAGVQEYPRLALSLGPGELALAAAILLAAALPFAGRASRLGVAPWLSRSS
jgi:energy-coupling factor transport system permease protein